MRPLKFRQEVFFILFYYLNSSLRDWSTWWLEILLTSTFFYLSNPVAFLCSLHPFKNTKTFTITLCDTLLPCRACINCVGWDWERDHRTRWCGGFMSSNPIPSPCGIPLIFSSVQIRLYCSSFGCYCYHFLSLSNSSHLIWSYFHMQDLAGGWWFCDRKANELEMDTSCPEKKEREVIEYQLLGP